MESVQDEKKHIFYLIRHGESKCNLTKKLLPANEDVLTDSGKEQASLLGEYLSEERFTRAFSSDYIRALHTAQMVLSKSKSEVVQNLEIKQDERIHERWLGIYQNLEIRDVLKYFMKQLVEEKKCLVDIEITEGDTIEKMFNNVETFLADIFKVIDGSADDSEPERILTVSHGLTMAYFVHHLSRSIEKYDLINSNNETLMKLCPNTGFIKIAIEKCPAPNKPRKIEFIKILETEHLKPMKRDDVLHAYTKTDETAKKFEGCIHQ